MCNVKPRFRGQYVLTSCLEDVGEPARTIVLPQVQIRGGRQGRLEQAVELPDLS